MNKSNEFVGLIFDDNIQSLVLNCLVSDKQARAFGVDSAAISPWLCEMFTTQNRWRTD